eukprot:CAMPEP_0183718882 /NCGR_PEP_ID=MMETSP0737-20130205/12023_1 /TAXON_ID=385413 /ORGANISM="Thalassiosira miniscula, Strain CCMP1093" /LENGTH=438 /DNA_ID=CAMNT_0025948525 /DNA_START=109 /DNA_END=1425 /DNA_ORIENTATION=-
MPSNPRSRKAFGCILVTLATFFTFAFAQTELGATDAEDAAANKKIELLDEEIKILMSEVGQNGASSSNIATSDSSLAPKKSNNQRVTHAVVHMGPTKSGSTLIQQESKMLKETFQSDGYEMPWAARIDDGAFVSHGYNPAANQKNFALCFVPLGVRKDTKMRNRCLPELLAYGLDIAARNQSIFLSAEHFGWITREGVDKLADYLSPWDKTTAVVFYRRFHDLLVSRYNQNTKTRRLQDEPKWEQSILDLVSHHLQNVKKNIFSVSHLSLLVPRLRTRFDEVLVLNFHDQSRGGPHADLFCQPSLNMTNMCKAIRDQGPTPHMNSGINLDYSNLAYAAKKAGLVDIDSDERMVDVANAARIYHRDALDSIPFARVCPPSSEIEQLWSFSLSYELEFFPETDVDDMKSDFETFSTEKLCKVDVEQTLKVKSWQDFFRGV